MNTADQQAQEWQTYNLDHRAQQLVLANRDKKNVLNESHKMRMAVAYGLERFWGEHLRFEGEFERKCESKKLKPREKELAKEQDESWNKGQYWKSVWVALAEILSPSGIELPDPKGEVKFEDKDEIAKITDKIWNGDQENQQGGLDQEDRQVALMVLTQLCNSLVWWTQRLKKGKDEQEG
jgi:hypothetical protein